MDAVQSASLAREALVACPYRHQHAACVVKNYNQVYDVDETRPTSDILVIIPC